MIAGLTFRRLRPADAGLIAQIDRSETVSRIYSIRSGELRAEAVHQEIPRWSAERRDSDDAYPGFNLGFRIERLRSRLAKGWIAIGAFDQVYWWRTVNCGRR